MGCIALRALLVIMIAMTVWGASQQTTTGNCPIYPVASALSQPIPQINATRGATLSSKHARLCQRTSPAAVPLLRAAEQATSHWYACVSATSATSAPSTNWPCCTPTRVKRRISQNTASAVCQLAAILWRCIPQSV